MVWLVHVAHRAGKVEGTDEQHVDARNFQYLVDSRHRVYVLRLEHHQRFSVGRFCVFDHAQAVKARPSRPQAADAAGRIQAIFDRSFGFFFGIDQGNHYSLGSSIQHALDGRLVVAGDPRQGRAAAALDRGEKIPRRFQVDLAVLHIH